MVTKKQKLIDASKEIIKDYTDPLTVRQLFYRLVSKLIIENTQKEYKYLISVLSDARVKTQEIPFSAFMDRTRSFSGSGNRAYWDVEGFFNSKKGTYEDAEDDFKTSDEDFWLPRWHLQPIYVEVWCEKDALANIFEKACDRKSVVFGASKGQASLSWLYDAYNRLLARLSEEHVERVVILVYSDFDPTGLDIFRNFKQHMLTTFGLSNVEFIRKAITKSQITQYNIPSMPTKKSNSLSDKWIAEHGDVSCVELDAIDPPDLTQIILDDIDEFIDDDLAEERQTTIDEAQKETKNLIDEYFEDKEGNL